MHEEITYKNYVYNFVYWMVKVINDLLKNTVVLSAFEPHFIHGQFQQ